jgi:hypothetical protein
MVIDITSLLMQASVIDQISATATSLSALISVVVGIVTYAITQFRKVRKEELSERDKWIMESLKAAQLNTQKAAETIGQSKEVMKVIYEAGVPEEQRKIIEEKVTPMLKQTDERLKAANLQAVMIKGRAVQIFGDAGDVDKDPTIPREAAEISMQLRGNIG